LLNKINNKISLSGFQPLQHKQTPLKPTKKPTINTAMKNTKLTLYTTIACLGTCLPSANAAVTAWTGATDGDFGTASNWDTGLPGTGAATIGNGNTVNLSTNYTTTVDHLIVNGNSTLDVSASVTAKLLTIQNTGTVNLTGGAFTLPKTSVSNNGGGLTIDAGGTLNISGGDHIFNERSTINGTFRVDGSASTIRMNQIGTANGDFEFIFDEGGVSTITGDLGFSWLSIPNADVTVDGSGFSGIGSFTLFDGSAAGNTPPPGSFTITGLGAEGVGWTLDITNNTNPGPNDTIVLTVLPEPSSTALLGLGGLAMMLRRKRN
jgi:hypothetical protein